MGLSPEPILAPRRKVGGCEKDPLPVRRKTVGTGCEMQDQNFYLFDSAIIGILVILYALGITVVYVKLRNRHFSLGTIAETSFLNPQTEV